VCSNLVVAELKILNPQITGTVETNLKATWTGICKGILDHLKASADINLLAGDITVPGLGLLDSVSGPVTGSALSSAALLPGKIQ